MIIKIRAIPNAKNNEVTTEVDKIQIKVAAQPESGKANKEIIKILADHYKIKKSKIRIIQGLKSRDKVIKIEES